MSSIFVGRTRARSQAIQLLFQADVQGIDVYDLISRGDYALEDGPLEDYAKTLAQGVARTRLTIDRLLTAVSHNWNLTRMPLVDRTIMAISIYEQFFQADMPVSVCISEAVEIAKVYGTDDSSKFINGVLGRVARLAAEHPEASLPDLVALADPDAPKPAAAPQAEAAEAQAEPAKEGGDAAEPQGTEAAAGPQAEEGAAEEPEAAEAQAEPAEPAEA